MLNFFFSSFSSGIPIRLLCFGNFGSRWTNRRFLLWHTCVLCGYFSDLRNWSMCIMFFFSIIILFFEYFCNKYSMNCDVPRSPIILHLIQFVCAFFFSCLNVCVQCCYWVRMKRKIEKPEFRIENCLRKCKNLITHIRYKILIEFFVFRKNALFDCTERCIFQSTSLLLILYFFPSTYLLASSFRFCCFPQYIVEAIRWIWSI